MSRADAYLTIPVGYASEAGGWRWSLGCDAVEDEDGRTLALVDQLIPVLEGVFAAPPVPPFAFVLHLLALLKARPGPHPVSAAFDWLAGAYAATKPPARNVGLLVAELCRGLPTFHDPSTWHELDLALKRRMLFGERHRSELIQVPGLGPAEFARAVAAKLAAWDDATLTHWLKHGGPPADGRALAEATETFPQRAAGFLELLRRRERLVGAATLAPALDAALTLPPRRPRPESIPQGGYVDVTTRGEPDRLLPSQFALEGDEFVRRFAERELLYFRREEPHRPTAPERWLVLDQGVRTWGPVRLGLTAGVVALLGKDPEKFGRPTLALTSHPGPFDPAELPPEKLADRLEASDLTPNPGDALALALDSPTDSAAAPRDVILFTHPRSLSEGDVRGAVRLRGPNDRIFTVTVDESGRAELGEWAPGGWVSLRTFRVDLAAGEAARVAQPAPARPKPTAAEWTGDVEPVPFPFRAGLAADVESLGFDADGKWAVVVGRGGVVHAKNLADDSPVEVLPRAFRGGEVLKRVEAVLGVAGGVVLGGRMPGGAFGRTGGNVTVSGPSGTTAPLRAQPTDSFVAAHYDFAARAVKLHPLGPVVPAVDWRSFPDLHCVCAATRPAGYHPQPVEGMAVDLATGGCYPGDRPIAAAADSPRAQTALYRSLCEPPNPARLPVRARGVHARSGQPYLETVGDAFVLHGIERPWSRLRPVVEGEPIARSAGVYAAELAGDVLAVLMNTGRKPTRLYVLCGPDAAILGEFGPANAAHAFALSRDGGRLARQIASRSVEVRETPPGGAVLAALAGGGYHTSVHLHLDAARLRVRVGRYEHTFTLNEVPFRHERATPQPRTDPPAQPWGYGTSAVCYDRDRFTELVGAGPWVAGFDRWGQVVLLKKSGELVMTVAVRRELAAAWLPDGTRWGSAALLGGPPHPNAMMRIGLALQDATGE